MYTIQINNLFGGYEMLGVRGHDIGKIMSAAELAKQAKEKDIDCIQLVAYKSFDKVKPEYGCLTHGFAEKVGRAFLKEDVRIALLGCYINLPHDDLNRFKEYIMHARSFGCPIVGTETGSVNPDYSFHPDSHGEEAFQKVVQVVKELAAFAEKFGVFVGIEAVETHIVHTPEKMKRLLELVDSPNVQVIFDPVNLISIENYKNAKEMIEYAFENYGSRMAIIHAKDFLVENGKIVRVPVGKGLMDYDHFYECLYQYKCDIDVIVEECEGQDLEDGLNFLRPKEKQYH